MSGGELSQGRLRQRMREIAAQQAGRDLVEYALVSLVIGLGVIASTRAIAAGIGAAFAYVGSTLSSAV